MDKESIKSKLQPIFQDVFDDDELIINDGLTAHDVLDWDSVSHITLVVIIEEEFSIELSAEEAGNLNSVGELIEMILTKLH